MRAALVVALISLAGCGEISKITADASDVDVVLWIHDSDVAPGDTIATTVRVDRGARVRIANVFVDGAGKQQQFDGDGDTWGSKILTKDTHMASATVDFAIAVPDDTPPDSELALTISVSIVAAETASTTFTNRAEMRTFHRVVTVRSASAVTWRRLTRGGIAAGACLLVIVLVALVRRWYARRNVEATNAWGMLLLPYLVPGYYVFAESLGRALRIHGVLFVIVCLVAWYAILAIPALLTSRTGMHAYTIAAAAPADKPTIELEGAWMAAGFQVERKRDQLFVAWPGLPAAIVAVPATDTFGAAPFQILSRDRQTVITMLDAIVPVLGALRCSSPESGELQFHARTSS